jgi:glutathione peroxidase
MKALFILLLMFQISLGISQQTSSLHGFKVENIFGDTINLSMFAGKKLLIVNTASFCGYTHQFTKLQKLDSTYQSQNFRVIGFPCNDFGGQDPFADSTINSFCQNQYGITFPMMSKVFIKNGDTSQIYKWLQKKSLNGVKNVSVDWNFNKFLVDEQGRWVRHFRSTVEPNDTAITNWIQRNTTSNQTVQAFQEVKFVNEKNGQFRVLGLDSKSEITEYELIDITGRKTGLGKVSDKENVIKLGNRSGIYQVRLFTKASSKSFRLWLN